MSIQRIPEGDIDEIVRCISTSYVPATILSADDFSVAFYVDNQLFILHYYDPQYALSTKGETDYQAGNFRQALRKAGLSFSDAAPAPTRQYGR